MNCFCKTTASARPWLYLKRLYFSSSAIAYYISPYASFYAGHSCFYYSWHIFWLTTWLWLANKSADSVRLICHRWPINHLSRSDYSVHHNWPTIRPNQFIPGTIGRLNSLGTTKLGKINSNNVLGLVHTYASLHS